jgi:hypothetical protein
LIKITGLNFRDIDLNSIDIENKTVVACLPFDDGNDYAQLHWVRTSANSGIYRWHYINCVHTYLGKSFDNIVDILADILESDCPYSPFWGSHAYVMAFDTFAEYGQWLLELK